MKMTTMMVSCVVACLCSAFAAAEEGEDKAVKWSGDASVGATFTRGNSHTDDINLTGNAVRRSEIGRLTLGASYFYGRQKDVTTRDKTTTKDSWFVQGKYDYFMSEKLYLFTNGRYEQDKIADLDERVLLGTGFGYQWIETPAFSFSTEAGTAWVHEEYDTGRSSSEWSGQAGYSLESALNENVKFIHNTKYYPVLEDFSDYLLTSQAELRSSLTKSMFASFKVSLDYDSTPAAGQKHLDTRYIVGIGIGF